MHLNDWKHKLSYRMFDVEIAEFFYFILLQITTDDLLQAAQIEERGMLDRKDRSLETWKQVAINEAAMAVVAVNFPDLKNIEFV